MVLGPWLFPADFRFRTTSLRVTGRPAAFTTSMMSVLHSSRWPGDLGAFTEMPILADALQNAGCENENLLNHCRCSAFTHVRGCWVVDLVLRGDNGGATQ